MHTTFKVCKLFLLLCLGLSTNSSPILTGLKTTPSDYQQSDSSFHHEYSFSSNPGYKNLEIKTNVQPPLAIDQSLKNAPGVTTIFKDQYGNLVSQVKKEVFNNENGQSSHGFEFQESKQLPNGYSKSFKKEYSSSSAIQSQPTTFIQKPLTVDKYYNSEIPINEETSQFGQYSQNYQGSLTYGNSDNFGIKSNLKPTIGESLTNVPAVTSTFRDHNGNLVTQVKKETVNNNNGQNAHALEFEETKQLPNGYSKSFKKEYSSSSVIQSQPTTFIQKPLTVDKYYNSEKPINEETSQFGQYSQNYQGSLTYGNSDNFGIKSNLKPTIGESLTNVPAVTSTFRDHNGNLVTQVKKETVNNNNGQNAHALEFEETKQLPNGYSKSFKKEYSSSSAIQSQPTTFIQTPLTVDKYYNSEKPINEETSQFGQYSQNYQGSLTYGNSDNFGIKSNLKPTIGESLTNVPAVTSTFRDHNGNLVTQVKKETVNNNNGQNAHALEFEETKQLPNGYSKSFKKEYSSSSVIQSQPTTFIQKPLTEDKYYNSEKPINEETSQFGQYSQNYQGSLTYGNSDNFGIKSNLKPTIGESLTNVPAVTSTFRDHNGNLVTQVKKETVNNNNGQNAHALEFEETKQLPNGYSKSFKKEYSSSSVISPYPKITEIQTSMPQKFIAETENFNGYNTFFNNQKQPFNPSGSINSQIINNKPYTQNINKTNAFGYNLKDQIDCDESESSSSSHQTFKQQSVKLNTYPKPPLAYQQWMNKNLSQDIEQKSVNFDDISKSSPIDNKYTPIKPKEPKFEFSSTKTQNMGQASVDLHAFSKPSPVGQESVNIDNLYTTKKPEIKPTGQHQIEKFEFSSTQIQNFGQESVDLHALSKPSSTVQESVNIDDLYTPNKPEIKSTEQFEKLKSSNQNKYSSVGQQQININDNSKSSQQYGQGQQIISQPTTGQQIQGLEFLNSNYGDTTHLLDLGVNRQRPSEYVRGLTSGQQNINNEKLLILNKPIGQNAFSTNAQNIGQKSVDLDDFSKSSSIGQESINIDNAYTSNKPDEKPIGQHQIEKFEFSSTQTENFGQESVDFHNFPKPSPVGQESVNIDNLYTPKLPDKKRNGEQFEKMESFSTHTHNFGQESVDLQEFSKQSPVGQESVNIDYLYTTKKPEIKPGQHQIEKFEFSSTQTENFEQESVDSHNFPKPSPVGQESVNIDNLYTSKLQEKKRNGEQSEKVESFSTHTQNFGQESVDLHEFSKPSPVGQESVNIDNLYATKKPEIKPTGQHQVEKFEFSSTQTQNFGQESVDLHALSKQSSTAQESVNIDDLYTPNKPEIKSTEQQFEKLKSSNQNKYSSVGQQIISQPTTGQQIQGLEFLNSNYGDTTHLLDLGIGVQQPTEYKKGLSSGQQNINNEKLLEFSKPIGQQAVVFERHDTIEKNIDLSNLNNLPTNVNNYQTLHGQSMKSPVLQGQQAIDITSDFEGNKPTYQKHYGNEDFQKSEFSLKTGKLNTGKDQSINFKYDSVFDKLGQLEHEILAPKSTVNINKDNFQTSYSTSHNVKSMPQSNQQVSSFTKTIDENTQYIEPQSEIISSSSFQKETESVVQQDIIKNHEHFMENPTTQSSVWKKFGDKVKGTIQNAKNKTQQLVSTINEKVGFSKNNDSENPC